MLEIAHDGERGGNEEKEVSFLPVTRDVKSASNSPFVALKDVVCLGFIFLSAPGNDPRCATIFQIHLLPTLYSQPATPSTHKIPSPKSHNQYHSLCKFHLKKKSTSLNPQFPPTILIKTLAQRLNPSLYLHLLPPSLSHSIARMMVPGLYL